MDSTLRRVQSYNVMDCVMLVPSGWGPDSHLYQACLPLSEPTYKIKQLLKLVRAECVRYVPPNAVVTINTVIYLSSFFSPCVYFSSRMTLLVILNFCMQTYIGPKR